MQQRRHRLVQGQCGLLTEFQNSEGCIERPRLNKTNKNGNWTKNCKRTFKSDRLKQEPHLCPMLPATLLSHVYIFLKNTASLRYFGIRYLKSSAVTAHCYEPAADHWPALQPTPPFPTFRRLKQEGSQTWGQSGQLSEIMSQKQTKEGLGMLSSDGDATWKYSILDSIPIILNRYMHIYIHTYIHMWLFCCFRFVLFWDRP